MFNWLKKRVSPKSQLLIEDSDQPSIDVNRPLTNSRLSRLLDKVVDGSMTNIENDELSLELTKAHYLAILMKDKLKMEETGPNGQMTILPGSQISFLLAYGPDRERFFPLFTDWDAVYRFLGANDSAPSTLILAAKEAFDIGENMMNDSDIKGIVINPSNQSLPINKQNLDYLKDLRSK